MTYAEDRLADQRLMLLQALAEANGYTLPERMLARFLSAMATPLSADALRTQLAWLEEQQLVAVEKIARFEGAAPEWAARLVTRGLDVVAGLARVPGVARPRP